jgi:hypothetical protein
VRRLIGRFVLVDESHLDKASDMFARHGGKAILIGHLVPGVGGFISILAPAGRARQIIMGSCILGWQLRAGQKGGLASAKPNAARAQR